MSGPDAISDDEDFLIEDEDVAEPQGGGNDLPDPTPPWCLLVVDDEPGVHAITQLALKAMTFKGRRLEIVSAYSGADALEILRTRRDIAVILLDVVMETDDAGLRCARAIREEIGNREVRIILRTGQPGQAPEQRVILDYDINDYKAKTELTSQKLMTTMIAALRTYDHIMTIETSRRGLDMVIDASASLFMARSLEQLHSGVLLQLQAMIGVGEDGILCVQRGLPPGMASGPGGDRIIVLAASGRYRDAVNQPVDGRIPSDTLVQIETSFQQRQSIFGDRLTTLYIATASGREVVASFDSHRPLSPHDRRMIEVFAAKVSLSLDNLHQFNQMRVANAAAGTMIAQLTECMRPGAGRHALAVAKLGDEIANRLATDGPYAGRLDGVILDLLAMAGLVTAGQAVLPDPPPLGGMPPATVPDAGVDPSGWFDLGARIISGRLERWDGTGAPKGLAGEDIPLAARIVAVAERFESLCADGLPAAEAASRIQAEAGSAFDPAVVAAFNSVLDRYLSGTAQAGA